MSLPGYLALFAVGFGTAIINVIVAGGPFLTLPLLPFLGLPASAVTSTGPRASPWRSATCSSASSA